MKGTKEVEVVEEEIFVPNVCTKEEKARYNELLEISKMSLVQLVTALKEIKDKGLYIKVAGFEDDAGWGWKYWLQHHCPIQPKMAQLYLTVAEEFGDVSAVELVRDHSAEIQQIIKYKHNHDQEIGEVIQDIKFDRKRNKFVLHIQAEDEDGNEVTKKIPVEDYIDSLVKAKLAKAQSNFEKSGKANVGDDSDKLIAQINSLRAKTLSEVSVINTHASLLEKHDESLLASANDLLDGFDKARDLILRNFPALRRNNESLRENNGFPPIKEMDADDFKPIKSKGTRKNTPEENIQELKKHFIDNGTSTGDRIKDDELERLSNITPEQKQIIEDYQGKYLKCLRDYENEYAGYSHSAGATLYIQNFNAVEIENQTGSYILCPMCYMNGNIQIFEMELSDIQENFEIITDVKEFKKARKMFAFVKE